MHLLSSEQINSSVSRLGTEWHLSKNAESKQCLKATYPFPNFSDALNWVNKLSTVAEELQHHPNISFTWGVVELQVWSHDAGGLTERDFQLAERLDIVWKATV